MSWGLYSLCGTFPSPTSCPLHDSGTLSFHNLKNCQTQLPLQRPSSKPILWFAVWIKYLAQTRYSMNNAVLCDVHSCSVVFDSLRLHGLLPARLLCSWNSPGKNWSGLSFLSPGGLLHPGIELMSFVFPVLAGGFFTTVPPGKPTLNKQKLALLPFFCFLIFSSATSLASCLRLQVQPPTIASNLPHNFSWLQSVHLKNSYSSFKTLYRFCLL